MTQPMSDHWYARYYMHTCFNSSMTEVKLNQGIDLCLETMRCAMSNPSKKTKTLCYLTFSVVGCIYTELYVMFFWHSWTCFVWKFQFELISLRRSRHITVHEIEYEKCFVLIASRSYDDKNTLCLAMTAIDGAEKRHRWESFAWMEMTLF